MSVENAIRWILVNNPAVYALVGERVRPVRANQNDPLPFVVFSRSSTQRFPHMTGDDGLELANEEIGCFDATYSGVKNLSEKVFNAVHMYRREDVGPGENPWDIRRATITNMYDVPSDVLEGSDDLIHGVMCEARVWYKQE